MAVASDAPAPDATSRVSCVPDGLTTYKVVIDPTNANVSYVATSGGLFRSGDDGATYVNVNLPTNCATNCLECCGRFAPMARPSSWYRTTGTKSR